jgi:hypothetical protein
MKRIVAWVIAACLLCGVGSSMAQADIPSSYPDVPERPASVQPGRPVSGVPLYSIAAGVVAVALSGSLIALRRIRKNGGNATP